MLVRKLKSFNRAQGTDFLFLQACGFKDVGNRHAHRLEVACDIFYSFFTSFRTSFQSYAFKYADGVAVFLQCLVVLKALGTGQVLWFVVNITP